MSTDVKNDHSSTYKQKYLISPKKFLSEINDRYGSNITQTRPNLMNKPSVNSVSKSVPSTTTNTCDKQAIKRFVHNNLRIIFSLPKVEGDNHDDIDECDYGREMTIKQLKKDAKRLSRMEDVINLYPLNDEDPALKKSTMEKSKKNKFFRKSQSVMPTQGILKKSDTIGQGSKKKVQFNSKKTVFRYNPHR